MKTQKTLKKVGKKPIKESEKISSIAQPHGPTVDIAGAMKQLSNARKTPKRRRLSWLKSTKRSLVPWRGLPRINATHGVKESRTFSCVGQYSYVKAKQFEAQLHLCGRPKEHEDLDTYRTSAAFHNGGTCSKVRSGDRGDFFANIH